MISQRSEGGDIDWQLCGEQALAKLQAVFESHRQDVPRLQEELRKARDSHDALLKVGMQGRSCADHCSLCLLRRLQPHACLCLRLPCAC